MSVIVKHAFKASNDGRVVCIDTRVRGDVTITSAVSDRNGKMAHCFESHVKGDLLVILKQPGEKRAAMQTRMKLNI